MPRQLNLQEYERSDRVNLSLSERDAIAQVDADITIQPVPGSAVEYTLTPSSKVGAFDAGGLSVLIKPKIGIPQLLSLACYAISAYKQEDDREFDFTDQDSLPDALARAFARAARQAFSRGLLHGYRRREEALQTVRGRIRFADQIRRRYAIAPPIEVRYQEFTDDVLENRLVKAAAQRLGTLRLRAADARRDLGWVMGTLDNVSLQEFRPNAVPSVTFGRLNDHYAGVIALSRLILRHGAFESQRGNVRAAGFLMDMNVVFQEFLTTALREELRGAPGSLLTDNDLNFKHEIWLAEGKAIRLRPDLTYWLGNRPVWVGDAKYKKTAEQSVPNADLYQMLAYTAALNLPNGTLIYAKGESEERSYTVNHTGTGLAVKALDLELPLDGVLEQVHDVAAPLKSLYRHAA